MNCKECGKPAIGIVFTKGVAEDVALCKKCSHTPQYAGWDSQTFNAANSPTGLMIRNMIKGAH
jgi:hypothetical protein